MRHIYYQIWEELKNDVFLHYNTFSNQFLLLNKNKHLLFLNEKADDLQYKDPGFYKLLCDYSFIVHDDFEEYEVASYRKRLSQFGSSMYQVLVNTTLDCNLNCWYCYENRIKGSALKDEVIEGIIKNIILEYV